MKLSIVIPTINRTGDLNQDRKINNALMECVVSLQETTDRDVEIIIVSNNDDPKALPVEVNYNRIIRVNVWEQGQCRAVNAGVGVASGDWIMVTNDDMVYYPGWTKHLTEEYDCYSPMLIEPTDGAPTFKKVFYGGADGDFDRKGWLEYAASHEGSGWRTGFNLPFVIRKELFDLIGGYDVAYDPWGSNSDSDLEYKIKLAGVQPMQNTDWVVYHFSQTSGTFHPSKRKWWEENYKYFIDKWGFERVDSPEIWEASFEIPKDKLLYKPKWAKL